MRVETPLQTHYLAFAGLVLGGLMLSVMLAPRAPEMALIYFKTEQLNRALNLYGDMYARGDRSIAVVMPLAKVYQRLGEVEESITILEAYGIDHPDNPDVLDLLSDAYQSDQRGYDQLRVLERLSRIKPTEKRLRELAHLYNYYGQYRNQVGVLRQLVELAPTQARYYLDLAQMLASQGQLGEATGTLSLMLQRNVETKDTEYIGLQVKLLLANGQSEDALAWARDAVKADPTKLAEYLSVFQERKRPDLALGVARDHQDRILEDPVLMAQYIEILVETGGNDQALKTLQGMRTLGLLPKGLRTTLVDLAFNQKLIGLALSVASTMDPQRLPKWLLGSLLESALLLKDLGFIESIRSGLDEQYLADNPVLAARLALVSGDDRELSRWLAVADSKTDMSQEQSSDLAQLYLKLGMTDRAMVILRGLIEHAEVEGALLAEMAPLYLRADRIEEGLSVFERLRRSRDDPAIEKAWALLASASGRLSALQHWLQTGPAQTLSDQELESLYYAAADRKHHNLALLLAERIKPRRDAAAGSLFLANALFNAGQPQAAMAELRPWMDGGDPTAQALWQNALFAAWEHGAPVRDDLIAYWDKRLKESNLSREQHRQIAFQMLDLGEKARAETQFKRLASGGSADGSDLQQLLYLWGPYPRGQRLDWLVEQARRSRPSRRAGWFSRLEDAGAYKALSALIQRIAPPLRDARGDELLLNAFSADKRLEQLDKELLRQATATSASKELERLAKRARAEDRGGIEQQIWERLLEFEPDHAQALRYLGLAAFVAENREQARDYLEHYLALYDGDWETVYFLAESLSNLGLEQRALPQYERALGFLDVEPTLSKPMRVAQAQIMHRTKRLGAALEAYDALYRDYPEDADLRADYIGMLLESGEMRRAKAVLEGE